MPTEILPRLDQAVIRVRASLANPDQVSINANNFIQLVSQFARVANQVGHAALYGVAAVNPVTTAAGPWIAAARVARQITPNITFNDMLPSSEGGHNLYPCTCGRCFRALRYIIGRQEMSVARTAVGATVVGLIPAVIHYAVTLDTANKTLHAHQLHDSARPEGRVSHHIERRPGNFAIDGVRQIVDVRVDDVIVTKYGCPKAQAIIAVLCGEHTSNILGCLVTIAILVRNNGYSGISEKIS